MIRRVAIFDGFCYNENRKEKINTQDVKILGIFSLLFILKMIDFSIDLYYNKNQFEMGGVGFG